MAGELRAPQFKSKAELGIEDAQEIVRDALMKMGALSVWASKSFRTEDEERAYQQGRKDAARVILMTLGVLELGPTSRDPAGTWEG